MSKQTNYHTNKHTNKQTLINNNNNNNKACPNCGSTDDMAHTKSQVLTWQITFYLWYTKGTFWMPIGEPVLWVPNVHILSHTQTVVYCYPIDNTSFLLLTVDNPAAHHRPTTHSIVHVSLFRQSRHTNLSLVITRCRLLRLRWFFLRKSPWVDAFVE